MIDIGALINAGRLAEACAVLKRVDAGGQLDAPGLALLAKLQYTLGDPAAGADVMARVLTLMPGAPGLQYEAGVINLAADRLAEAARLFRAELALSGDHPDALFNLAWALRRLGRDAEAAEALRRLLRSQPGNAEAWFNLGNILAEAGQSREALAAFEKAATFDPAKAAAHANAGMMLQRLDRLDDAERALRQALALAPEDDGIGNALGNVLTSAGRAEDALAVFRAVAIRRPQDAQTRCNAALALRSLNRPDAALAELDALVPPPADVADYWNTRGAVLYALDRLAEAGTALRRAIALQPDSVEALNNLAAVLAAQARQGEAIQVMRLVLALRPDHAETHSNLLFMLQHLPGLSREALFAEHCRFGAIQEAAVPAQTPPPRPIDGRRLRIGYVSPDLREHALALFFEPVLRHHDRSRHEIFGYYTGRRRDQVTERMMRLCDHWRDIAPLSADQAADQIRRDGIDVLVDLAGHTSDNGLPIFVRKPAPVQATWLGYPGTTGLSRIDYRITDEGTDPPGSEAYYTETLERLAFSAVFEAPPDCPEPSPPPCLRRGRVRFASLNRPMKLSDPVVRTWAAILQRVPASELLLLAPGGESEEIRDGLVSRFVAHGIAAERIVVVPRRPFAGFISLVSSVDVALDPFPYGGGTTSFLTLWMGVPIVALASEVPGGSVSVGLLSTHGLEDLVAADPDDYVDKACRLAADPRRLTELRRSLRPGLGLAQEAKARNFTRCLEAAYRSWLLRLTDPERWRALRTPVALAAPAPADRPEDPGPMVQDRRVLSRPFLDMAGFGRRFRGVHMPPPDDEGAPDASRLVLLEDGVPLGPPHALHQAISAQGLGRYSHWRGSVYFSSSDGSDPETNGRLYEIARLAPSPRAVDDELFPDTLLAVYDLAAEVMTYDFLWFLVYAERERCRRGLERGHLLIVPGWHEAEGDRERLHNLLIPCVGLFPAWTGITLADDRHQADRLHRRARHALPADFHPWGAVSLHDAATIALLEPSAASEVPELTVPAAALRQVDRRLAPLRGDRRVVAITLRGYGLHPERNSNLSAWQEFAAGLDPEQWLVVWVPDTAAALSPGLESAPGVVFAEAAVDLHLRAALYQWADINMGINNGPMSLCYFNPQCRYLVFKLLNEAATATSRAFLERRGVVIGADLPFAGANQHLVWEDDQPAVLQRSFAALTARLNPRSRG